MTDIATIGAILGSIKTATEIAKIIKDSSSTLEEAEIKLQLAELISALADVKIEAADIQTELIDKDKIIEELQNKLKIKSSIKWYEPYYWVVKVESGEKEGPYCQVCYDKDEALIRLYKQEKGAWSCKVCKNNYLDKDYREPTYDMDSVDLTNF